MKHNEYQVVEATTNPTDLELRVRNKIKEWWIVTGWIAIMEYTSDVTWGHTQLFMQAMIR